MAKKEFSFNQAVTEIEKILQEIETGEMDIDRLSVEVKRASELIRQCQKKLKSTEEEINTIFKELWKKKPAEQVLRGNFLYYPKPKSMKKTHVTWLVTTLLYI